MMRVKNISGRTVAKAWSRSSLRIHDAWNNDCDGRYCARVLLVEESKVKLRRSCEDKAGRNCDDERFGKSELSDAKEILCKPCKHLPTTRYHF